MYFATEHIDSKCPQCEFSTKIFTAITKCSTLVIQQYVASVAITFHTKGILCRSLVVYIYIFKKKINSRRQGCL